MTDTLLAFMSKGDMEKGYGNGLYVASNLQYTRFKDTPALQSMLQGATVLPVDPHGSFEFWRFSVEGELLDTDMNRTLIRTARLFREPYALHFEKENLRYSEDTSPAHPQYNIIPGVVKVNAIYRFDVEQKPGLLGVPTLKSFRLHDITDQLSPTV